MLPWNCHSNNQQPHVTKHLTLELVLWARRVPGQQAERKVRGIVARVGRSLGVRGGGAVSWTSITGGGGCGGSSSRGPPWESHPDPLTIYQYLRITLLISPLR